MYNLDYKFKFCMFLSFHDSEKSYFQNLFTKKIYKKTLTGWHIMCRRYESLFVKKYEKKNKSIKNRKITILSAQLFEFVPKRGFGVLDTIGTNY